MRFVKSKFVLTVLVALTFTPLGHAQTTLKYQFKEGDKLHYDLDQKIKMTIGINGMNTDSKVAMTSDFTWMVVKVKDGNAELKIKFQSAKMSMDSPLGLMEADSKDKNEPADQTGAMLSKLVKAMGTLEMSAIMLPTGEMKDVKVSEEMLKAMKSLPGADQFGDMMSPDNFKSMVGSLVLLAEPIAKGKSWTNKTDIKTKLGKTVTENTFTYEGTTNKDGVTLDKISISPKVTIEVDPNAPLQIQIKDSKGSGSILFDNTKGRVMESTTTGRTEMNFGVGDMVMDQTVTIRLRKK